MFLVGHLRASTDVAKTIYTLLESYLIQTGSIQSPLQQYQSYPYIRAPWIDTLRSFLQHTNATIITPHLRIPPKLRTNDQAIMDIAVTQDFTIPQLRLLNNCRLYLQVITLAEITTNDGKYIQEIYLKPNKKGNTNIDNIQWSQSSYQWPQQVKPNNKAWRVWKKLINSLLDKSTHALKRPMGQWSTTKYTQRKYHYEISSCHTIIRHEKSHYIRQRMQQKQWSYHLDSTNIPINQSFHPIVPDTASRQEIRLTNFPPKTIANTTAQQLNTATRYHYGITIQNNNDPAQIIAKQVYQCTRIIIGTHCTQDYERQTFAWAIRILLSNNTSISILQSKALYLESRTCDETRGNFLSCLLAIKQLKQTFKIRRRTLFHLCCQNQKIVTWLHKSKNEYRTAKNMLRAEQELIDNIRKEIVTIGQYKTIHCKKNDAKNSHERDTIQSCISTIQNQAASKTANRIDGIATILHNKHEVSANIETELRNAASTHDLRIYMKKKYILTDEAIDDIDWMVHGNAISSLPARMKKTTIQFLHEWAPTLAHPGQHTHVNKLCPMCRHTEETLDHFHTCTNTDKEWTEQINNILKEDNKNNRIKPIIQLLQWALINNRSLQTNNTPPAELHHETTREIIHKQQHIGWHQMWKGRWTQAWVRQYNKNTKLDGEKWATTTITNIWTIQYTQWRQRCKKLHEKEELDDDTLPRQCPNEINNLEQKIQAIYDQLPKLDQIDQKVLSQPIERVLRLPPRLQKDWIKRTEGFVKTGIKRAKQRIKHRTHSIANFFAIRANPTRDPVHNRNNNDIPMRDIAHNDGIDPTEAANFRPP